MISLYLFPDYGQEHIYRQYRGGDFIDIGPFCVDDSISPFWPPISSDMYLKLECRCITENRYAVYRPPYVKDKAQLVIQAL